MACDHRDGGIVRRDDHLDLEAEPREYFDRALQIGTRQLDRRRDHVLACAHGSECTRTTAASKARVRSRARRLGRAWADAELAEHVETVHHHPGLDDASVLQAE